jgi:hypothetical protein
MTGSISVRHGWRGWRRHRSLCWQAELSAYARVERSGHHTPCRSSGGRQAVARWVSQVVKATGEPGPRAAKSASMSLRCRDVGADGYAVDAVVAGIRHDLGQRHRHDLLRLLSSSILKPSVDGVQLPYLGGTSRAGPRQRSRQSMPLTIDGSARDVCPGSGSCGQSAANPSGCAIPPLLDRLSPSLPPKGSLESIVWRIAPGGFGRRSRVPASQADGTRGCDHVLTPLFAAQRGAYRPHAGTSAASKMPCVHLKTRAKFRNIYMASYLHVKSYAQVFQS